MTKKNLIWIAFGIALFVFAVIQFIPPPEAPLPGESRRQQPEATTE